MSDKPGHYGSPLERWLLWRVSVSFQSSSHAPRSHQPIDPLPLHSLRESTNTNAHSGHGHTFPSPSSQDVKLRAFIDKAKRTAPPPQAGYYQHDARPQGAYEQFVDKAKRQRGREMRREAKRAAEAAWTPRGTTVHWGTPGMPHLGEHGVGYHHGGHHAAHHGSAHGHTGGGSVSVCGGGGGGGGGC